MKVLFYVGKDFSGNFGGRTIQTECNDPKHLMAWTRGIKWLSQSARFTRMWSEIKSATFSSNDASERVYVINVVGFSDQGKFFTPDETTDSFWGPMQNKPVVLVDLKAAVVGCQLSTLDYVGVRNADLYGSQSSAITGLKRPTVVLPDGWGATGRPCRDLAVQSPLVGIAHEVGHLWQWLKYKNAYNAIVEAAKNGCNDSRLRLEIHNVICNESVIAYQLGEGVRFSYNYDYGRFESLILYQEDGDKNLVYHNKAQWPKTQMQARELGKSGGTLAYTGDNSGMDLVALS